MTVCQNVQYDSVPISKYNLASFLFDFLLNFSSPLL